jgi:Kef-type K+ transport system membrane component KefB
MLRFLGQTQVVSEMVAGVLLGPSLLGLFFPAAQQFLFPATVALPGGDVVTHPSMSILYALSQLGLILYMFLIGLQLDVNLLTRHSRDALTVSMSGIFIPVVMGGALGLSLAGNPDLFTPGVLPWQAALFVASAMAITAFPMLARILYESGMARTRLGTLAIGAAAVDDAAAWCLLACVLAAVQGSPAIAALAIGGGAVYALVMVVVGRPIFRGFEAAVQRDGGLRVEVVAILMTVLMLCAWVTDLVGIYAIFGAFVAGLVMPRGRFPGEVQRVLEPMTVSLLLPIFFVYSGLNTRLSLLVHPALLGLAILTVVIAFACKGLGCMFASRAVGMSWRESSALGVLMNARGLMELILINIALERGLITSGLFTILVVMAIITTLAASPLFQLIYPRKSAALKEAQGQGAGERELEVGGRI